MLLWVLLVSRLEPLLWQDTMLVTMLVKYHPLYEKDSIKIIELPVSWDILETD